MLQWATDHGCPEEETVEEFAQYIVEAQAEAHALAQADDEATEAEAAEAEAEAEG